MILILWSLFNQLTIFCMDYTASLVLHMFELFLFTLDYKHQGPLKWLVRSGLDELEPYANQRPDTSQCCLLSQGLFMPLPLCPEDSLTPSSSSSDHFLIFPRRPELCGIGLHHLILHHRISAPLQFYITLYYLTSIWELVF